MSSITIQDGKVLLRDGAVGTEQACCCDDSSRIVKCCYAGVCAEVTAAECEFLGGFEVQDCDECDSDPGLAVDDCSECCNQDTISATVTAYFNDIGCQAIFGTGCNAIRYFGRLDDSVSASAQVELQRQFAGSCNYRFSGCAPLGEFGDFTFLSVRVFFLTDSGRCKLRLEDVDFRFQTCYAADAADFSACTQPATGGSCAQTIARDTGAIDGTVASLCSGAIFQPRQQTTTWADFLGGCAFTLVPWKPTGSPLIRDSGNVDCTTVDASQLSESTFNFISRVAIRVEP